MGSAQLYKTVKRAAFPTCKILSGLLRRLFVLHSSLATVCTATYDNHGIYFVQALCSWITHGSYDKHRLCKADLYLG